MPKARARSRVVVADDHAVVRAGLRLLLTADPQFELVGEAENLRGTFEVVRALRPALLILDLNLGDGTTLDALPAILEASPGMRVVVLTMEIGAGFARHSLAAGASGYVLKDDPPRELLLALGRVAAGEQYASSSLGVGFAVADDRVELTQRELEVLRLIAAGYTSAQSAQRLYLSPRTIEFHRAQIRQKLGLHDRAQLAEYARSLGLLGH